MVSDSIKSHRLILCKSQYVRARIVAQDFPIKLMLLIGSPNTSPKIESYWTEIQCQRPKASIESIFEKNRYLL